MPALMPGERGSSYRSVSDSVSPLTIMPVRSESGSSVASESAAISCSAVRPAISAGSSACSVSGSILRSESAGMALRAAVSAAGSVPSGSMRTSESTAARRASSEGLAAALARRCSMPPLTERIFPRWMLWAKVSTGARMAAATAMTAVRAMRMRRIGLLRRMRCAATLLRRINPLRFLQMDIRVRLCWCVCCVRVGLPSLPLRHFGAPSDGSAVAVGCGRTRSINVAKGRFVVVGRVRADAR